MPILSASGSIVCIKLALNAGNQVRMHQNGFLQLDLLDGMSRLHIWSEELPKAQDPRTPIHNHTFDFNSQIILGKLTHVEYDWIEIIEEQDGLEQLPVGINNDDPVCYLYTGSGDYQNLVPVGVEGTVHETGRFDFGVDDVYSFQHERYHDSWGNGLTATIMTKTALNQIPRATVVVPLGEGGPDNSFRRDQYPQELLMPFVQGVLAGLMDLDGRRHV